MLYLIVLILLIAIDQVIKHWAYVYLQPLGSIPLTSWFSLTYLENRGAAFGIMYGARWILTVVTLGILSYLLILFKKTPNTGLNRYLRWAMVLIAAGGIGNVIDRIRQGFVIDYLHATFINFPVFNFADVLIVMGAIGFGLLSTFFIKEDREV